MKRDLVDVIKKIKVVLKDSNLYNELEDSLNDIIYGQTFQAPESLVYWNRFEEEVLNSIVIDAEDNLSDNAIAALSIWTNKPITEVSSMIENITGKEINLDKLKKINNITKRLEGSDI